MVIAFIVAGGFYQPPKMGTGAAFITPTLFDMPNFHCRRSKDKTVHPEKY